MVLLTFLVQPDATRCAPDLTHYHCHWMRISWYLDYTISRLKTVNLKKKTMMSRCESGECLAGSPGTGLDPSIPIISLHPPLSITALVIHIHTQVISLCSWSHITFTAVIKNHNQKVTGLAAFLIDTSAGPHSRTVSSICRFLSYGSM